MNSGEAVDCGIFVFCIVLLTSYTCLYFTPWWQNRRWEIRGRKYRNLWSVGKEARTVWAAAMMADPKEGINAAQTVRNMVLGVSILAASSALLAAQVILLITDGARLDQIKSFAKSDPISPDTQFLSPQSKLGIALGVVFLSLLSMTQTVRLSVHLSYLLRAVSADAKRAARLSKVAFAINRRASLFFSLGLRLLYIFFPLFLYVLGPLALLIATLVELVAVFFMDLTPDEAAYEDGLGEGDHAEAAVENESVHAALTNSSPPGTPGGAGLSRRLGTGVTVVELPLTERGAHAYRSAAAGLG